MSKIQVRFVIEKETKNTVRFEEIENDQNVEQVIGRLYIQKAVLKQVKPDGWPREIAVTIEVE